MIATSTQTVAGTSVALIELNRPDQRNALTPEMLRELVEAIDAQATNHRALVLAGRGRVFCAGFDLKLCKAAPDGSVMRELLTGLSKACTTLRALPIPVVIAAHGAAIAGGCALLGGADLVITNTDAKLGYPVTKIGVSPAVSAPFLWQAVGFGAARERLLLPELISGRRAHEIGLAHELVDDRNDVLDRALQRAGELGAKPPGAIAATKAWLARLEPAEQQQRIHEALETSLSLTGGEEEQRLLAALNL
ncbi:MAG TPA: enoyl-CoA hydratase/isomerase family protein [Phycisphaerales bacterium]|nr:enoyl-CoA hydratase/isomerase family protein [Phycisphaerales bacterium]